MNYKCDTVQKERRWESGRKSNRRKHDNKRSCRENGKVRAMGKTRITTKKLAISEVQYKMIQQAHGVITYQEQVFGNINMDMFQKS